MFIWAGLLARHGRHLHRSWTHGIFGRPALAALEALESCRDVVSDLFLLFV